MNVVILVSKNGISLDMIKYTSRNCGTIVSFIGIIKEKNNNKKVKNIIYFVFEELFCALIKRYCLLLLRDKQFINIYINQYSGTINVGEINLVVSVQSENRKNAFAICHKITEFIKYNAPIWKKEIYSDKSFVWINA